jgi:CPA2 family monovalent cation:H+ antiporter-2
MILALVLLPALAGILRGDQSAGLSALALPILFTLLKVAAFVTVMLVVGKRVIPQVLHYTAHTGSRELFRLAVLAIALGVAYGASTIFDVSFALGAFFAGMILSESELSQRAASETLPLRDAFAVLFFVSVGMLVDPLIVVSDLGWLLATLLIIVVGKSLAAFAIVRLFGYPVSHALTISASLAQIGEFSFILAGLGVSLAVASTWSRSDPGRRLISILLTVLFVLLDRHLARKATAPDLTAAAEQALRQPDPAHRAQRSRCTRRLRPGRTFAGGLDTATPCC